MSIEEFESLSLTVGITALILFMMFIVYDLAKQSKAGKYGMFVLFGGLGLGVFGFVAKSLIMKYLNL